MSLSREEFLSHLRAGTAGLVLSGGGFKGAYEIGVWKALRELGVGRFSGIAGTSAGALNAVLVAQGDVTRAEELWDHFPGLRLVGRQVSAYLAGYTLTAGAACMAVAALLVTLVAGGVGGSSKLIALGIGSISLCGLWGAGALTTVCLATINRRVFFRIADHASLKLLAALSFLLAFAGPAGAALVFKLLDVSWQTAIEQERTQGWWIGIAALLGPLIGGAVTGAVGVKLLWFAQEHAHVFSNETLLARLRALVNLDQIRANTAAVFVTTTRSHTFLTPFGFGVEFDRSGIPRFADGRPQYKIADHPVLETRWIVDYHNLCECVDANRAVDLLRLSAALPAFLPAGMAPGDELVVDGGLVDNRPILPLVMAGITEILVVCLDPKTVQDHANRTRCEAAVDECYREYREVRITETEATDIYREFHDQGRAAWCPGHPATPRVSLCFIGPRTPLPTLDYPLLDFLTGTINQDKKVRRQWMDRGYHETLGFFRGDTSKAAASSLV